MSGLSPGPWRLLSTVVLACWTGSLAAAQEEISAFYVDKQSNTSVTLKWEPPNNNYTVTWAKDGQVIGTNDTSDIQYTVNHLQPGTTYEFTVRVQGNSSGRSLNASTLPNEVQGLRMDARSNSSVTLKWLAPDGPQPADYTYWISWGREDGLLSQNHTTEMGHIIDSLAPATVYNFTVTAEKNGVHSSGQSIQEATVPNEVQGLRMDARSNSSVTLKWLAPDGPQPADYTYWISWGREDGLLSQNHTTEMGHIIDSLAPATVYNFTVTAEKNGVHSSGQSIQEATVPNEVQGLRMDARSNSSVTLKWLAPDGPQPADYTYWISWGREGVPKGADNTSAEQYTAEPLDPGSPYEFTISSMSNEVHSSAQMLRVFTEPNEVGNLQVVRQINNSIEFSWMAPEGSTKPTYKVSWFLSETHQRQVFTNGTNFTADGLTPGTWYQFSVRSVTEDEAQSPERTVNASTAPDPVTITSCISDAAGYGVVLTLACPAGNQESFEYELGGHQGTWPRPCPSSMPIGGLQPDKSYMAIVWSLWAGMKAASAPVTCYTESGASHPGVTAGVIIGVLLFIVLVGLLTFFHLRHRRKSIQEKPQTSGVAFSSLGDISAENLAAYILENQKDSNYGFAEEYQHLALEGTGQPQTAALAPENKSKNRFSNVLPYDWSRVPLQPIPGDPSSDYINASFVPGLVGPQEYIATQGPLPQTVSDFWRLVWDQQSRTVVMLTNCVESGRVKCEHYWPLDAKPCSHGHLRVTLKGENVAEHWTVRDLHLFHMELKEGLSVRQFHYTVWPDHGVPRSPDPLLAFRALIRNWLDQSLGGGPPIVHCSAGVGRTGTLIALDVLLRQLQKYQQVGVQSFITKMRRSRPLMVQTEGQYIFLYQTLLRSLQLSQDGGEDCRDQEGVLYENMEAIQAYEQEIGFR